MWGGGGAQADYVRVRKQLEDVDFAPNFFIHVQRLNFLFVQDFDGHLDARFFVDRN